jgi:hypothetical protein
VAGGGNRHRRRNWHAGRRSSAEAFADAIARTLDRPFDRAGIRAHAERFSRQRFGDEMQTLIDGSTDRPP